MEASVPLAGPYRDPDGKTGAHNALKPETHRIRVQIKWAMAKGRFYARCPLLPALKGRDFFSLLHIFVLSTE